MMYRYPTDIGQKVDKLILKAFQTDPEKDVKEMISKMDMEIKTSKGFLGAATLPIPNTINDAYVHNWNITEGWTEETLGMLSSFGGDTLNSVKKFVSRGGVAIDPKYLQTYEGTAPRNFSFQWEFIPQNKSEASEIKDMIQSFKQWSAATPFGGALVNQPAIWEIQFESGPLMDMIKPQNMVATQISVDYAPGGYADFFHDSFPKQINLSMEFAEKAPMFYDDWN
jgi:hypothetical protein